jgi:hypothetical protein
MMTKKVTDDRLKTCVGFVRYLKSRCMPGPGPLTIEAYEDIEAALVELQERRAAEPADSPYNWSACDEHETVFPKGDSCPKCVAAEPTPPQCVCPFDATACPVHTENRTGDV